MMRELSWKSIKPRLMPAFRLWQQWGEPVLPLYRILRTLYSYPGYIKDWRQYRMLPGAESLAVKDAYPVLLERTPITPFDPHYLYQAVWATERIVSATQSRHIDVGSDIRFAAMLASHMPVTFVDIRPLQVDVPGFSSMAGSLFGLPFADGGVESVSCLHVIEHVGLGRYGDPLDPGGTRRACAELQRVVAPGGNLFLSTPVGRARVQFNAHRIHTPTQILAMFPDLTLVEFSGVDDQGSLVRNADLHKFGGAHYACGLFWLRKEIAGS